VLDAMAKRIIQSRFVTAAAREHLSQLLNLPSTGQDWEIEHADPSRLGEFLSVYEQQPLDDDHRFALMELVIASYDELLSQGQSNDEAWERIRRHLCERFALHEYTIQHWSLPDEIPNETPEGNFAVTGRMRELMLAFFGPRKRWPRQPVSVKRFCDWPPNVTPGTSLNSVEITDNRNDNGYCVTWSKIAGRPWGERHFATLEDAQRWAEESLCVRPDQWVEFPRDAIPSDQMPQEALQPVVLLLEDNDERIARFTTALRGLAPKLQVIGWHSAKTMLEDVDGYLPLARLISLDHDLYPTSGDIEDPGDGLEVAKYLAEKKPTCPIIIHSSNGDRARMMAGEFELAGCHAKMVAALGADWIEAHWAKVVASLLTRDTMKE
jgi:hypothetical protein